MSSKGKIKYWNQKKGFGFIVPTEGGKDMFIHISGFADRSRPPQKGQEVTYEVSTDKHGRPCAANATRLGDKPAHQAGLNYSTIALIGIVSFVLFLIILVIAGFLPKEILALYFGTSLIAFIIYALDKSAAENKDWRIQESTLHLVSMLGGWPGALWAQQKFRHKTRKESFRFVFKVTIAINIGLLVWFLTPSGSRLLSALLN